MKYENKIRKILCKVITVAKSADEITAETNLQDIGMDSITFVSLIIEIEDFFNIEFPDDKLVMSESGTIRKLCEVVDSMKRKVK